MSVFKVLVFVLEDTIKITRHRLKQFALLCTGTVMFLLQNAGLNDSANWPSLNKANNKVIVVVAGIINMSLTSITSCNAL